MVFINFYNLSFSAVCFVWFIHYLQTAATSSISVYLDFCASAQYVHVNVSYVANMFVFEKPNVTKTWE